MEKSESFGFHQQCNNPGKKHIGLKIMCTISFISANINSKKEVGIHKISQGDRSTGSKGGGRDPRDRLACKEVQGFPQTISGGGGGLSHQRWEEPHHSTVRHGTQGVGAGRAGGSRTCPGVSSQASAGDEGVPFVGGAGPPSLRIRKELPLWPMVLWGAGTGFDGCGVRGTKRPV